MPYSELHRMAKGQRESSTQTKMNNFSNDLAFVPDNEFVELLWENGQIVMQGQTSKTRKGSLCTGFSSQTPKAQQNDGEDAVLRIPAKSGRYVHLDSVMHDFPSSGQEGNVGLVQDDEMVPWLNYPLDDSFERDYYSDFFPELSGVNLNSISGQTNAVPVDKSNSYGQTVRSSSHTVSAHSGSNVEQGNDSSNFVRLESEPISNLHPSFKVRSSQLSSSQCQSSLPTSRSGVSEFVSNNPQVFSENSSQTPVLATGSFPAKLHQQDPPSTRPSLASNIGAVNFSHFARPAALVRANLQNIGVPTGLSSGDKLRSNAEMSVTSSNPVESSLVESTSLSKSVPGCHGQALSTLPKVDLQLSYEPSQEPRSVDYSEAICQEDPSGSKSRDQVLCPSSSFAASTAFGRSDSGKAFEPVVTSSSLCSGNSAGKASKDHKHGAKRKCREVEESGYQSEDVEEESVDVKKPSTGRSTNAKRSRAAEVHNLSERRRRDRINEKMRALQELIPNCNKVDKASMLDEAIEYLKTLQMQVQIMSMGSGLCMPPMMLPTGMQHMHTPHMARFSPMGVGMGVGFGMGMLDMSCSTSFPLIPVPSMHGAQIPCPSISGATSLPGIPGSSIQMFGIPGQGLSLPMPRGPFVPLSGFPARTGSTPDMSVAPNTALLPDSAPSCSSKGHVHNINLQRMHKTSGHRSEIQEAPKITTESFEQSALARRNHQTSHANGSEAPSSIS